MKLSFTIVVLFLFQLTLTAQTKQHQLSGKITDNNGEPVPYAAVAAFKTSDSSYVNGAASDMDGNFSHKLANGNYYVKVSFLSFENKIIPNININNKDQKLPTIKLTPSSLKLSEFEYKSQN